jgi:DNA-binding PadR family transcriptional regulator
MAKKSSAHTLEYILLGLIQQQPSYGYELYERLLKTPELSYIWQVKRSKLYYLLEKLESEGLLSVSIKNQGPYPDRKVYKLTSQGGESLMTWIHSPVLSSRYVRLAFLSKLYFALLEDRKSAMGLIDEQIRVCLSWLQNLQRQLQGLKEDAYISSQVFLFRIGQIQAMLDWLKNCRESIPDQ